MSPSPMRQSAEFSELTTIAVGGTAREMVSATHAKQLIDTALEVWAGGENWLLLGGGSNTIVADDGFDGIVIRVATRGIERLRVEPDSPDRSGKVLLRVQAGESWDDVVRYTVEHGWAGIEALSGIPGSSGAAPVQNIGAYGQELSSSLVAIEFLDYLSGELRRIPAGELGLGYRTSALKQGRLGVVVSVELELDAGADDDGVGATALSRPIAYAQLASALGVGIGDRVPLAEVRATVLELRAAKGMLLSESDPESVSAGSFFTNPIVSESFARTLPTDSPRWPIDDDPRLPVVTPLESFSPRDLEPRSTEGETVRSDQVKLSAAWLIENAGVKRGFSLPGSRASVSRKHSLAIVNRGGATADQVAELARYIQSRVLNEFGVILLPEPVLVGVHL
ncbi:MAG: UDP-N-acetylmuramate dehydrogenase [Microbacteriaceae bacterium]|nr:UDP-N-acetylmuramate dehydrogenase [Microbacteriaceae bacterium]